MPAWRRLLGPDAIFATILLAAALLRLDAAATSPYLFDEDRLAIPLAERISVAPGGLKLPIRGEHHPALPSYFIRASSLVFGQSRLGYRALHVLAGVLAIVLVFRITRDWFGIVAARWAAALLAFNEYHVVVSAYATAKGPHLLFVILAIAAFSRFLRTPHPGPLYAAGAATALAFYCKEHSVLLLAVFFLSLWRAPYRRWLAGAHPYLACLLFFALIAPDILWNLAHPAGDARFTYGDHLSRIGGLGFTIHHFLFFMRDAIQWGFETVAGARTLDYVDEYRSMNSAFGLLLLAAVAVATWRPDKSEGLRFFLSLFYVILGFFIVIRPAELPDTIDPVAWYWVDATLFPAVVVAGLSLARADGAWRAASWCFAGGAIVYAIARMLG